MALSQNGWEANNRNLIATAQIPGAGFGFAIRRGPATVVLTYVLTRFHNEVERLIPGQCWGYAERPIRGSTTTSNHASGTAVDANSLLHPLGARGTFSPAQVGRIHEILRACRGLVRWGGDYRGRADEMHFELIGSESQIADLAASLTQPGSRLPNIPIDPPEDDMPLTDADVAKIWANMPGDVINRIADTVWRSVVDGAAGPDVAGNLLSLTRLLVDRGLSDDDVNKVGRVVRDTVVDEPEFGGPDTVGRLLSAARFGIADVQAKVKEQKS